jgi:hypothetical protein
MCLLFFGINLDSREGLKKPHMLFTIEYFMTIFDSERNGVYMYMLILIEYSYLARVFKGLILFNTTILPSIGEVIRTHTGKCIFTLKY